MNYHKCLQNKVLQPICDFCDFFCYHCYLIAIYLFVIILPKKSQDHKIKA